MLPDKASLYLTAIEDAEYKEDKIECEPCAFVIQVDEYYSLLYCGECAFDFLHQIQRVNFKCYLLYSNVYCAFYSQKKGVLCFACLFLIFYLLFPSFSSLE